MINLLERSDSGSVTVDGVELTSLSDEELRRQRTRIGMIFQHFHLLDNLTAAQNVELALRVAGVPRDERAAGLRSPLPSST
jgi:D-methionine transport system ATP-binding protein